MQVKYIPMEICILDSLVKIKSMEKDHFIGLV